MKLALYCVLATTYASTHSALTPLDVENVSVRIKPIVIVTGLQHSLDTPTFRILNTDRESKAFFQSCFSIDQRFEAPRVNYMDFSTVCVHEKRVAYLAGLELSSVVQTRDRILVTYRRVWVDQSWFIPNTQPPATNPYLLVVLPKWTKQVDFYEEEGGAPKPKRVFRGTAQ